MRRSKDWRKEKRMESAGGRGAFLAFLLAASGQSLATAASTMSRVTGWGGGIEPVVSDEFDSVWP